MSGFTLDDNGKNCTGEFLNLLLKLTMILLTLWMNYKYVYANDIEIKTVIT